MLVSAINGRVSEIMQDVEGITWTTAQLIEWLNDAARSLALVRPDATAVTENVQLTAGTTKQALAGASDLRLIRLIRNMGSDGSTPGRAIRIGDMPTMDAFNPDWHADAGAAAVKEFMFNAERPKEFWVHPKPLTAFYVEAIKSVLPAAVADVGDTVPVDDIYAPALIEWILYRCFSRDSEETPNYARAARHFAAFFNLLQIKMQADMAINPKVRELVSK